MIFRGSRRESAPIIPPEKNERTHVRRYETQPINQGWLEQRREGLRSPHRGGVVEPARVRHFAKACALRAKTDRIDAALLAEFGRQTSPQAQTPLDKSTAALRELSRHRAQLQTMHRHWRIRRAWRCAAGTIASIGVDENHGEPLPPPTPHVQGSGIFNVGGRDPIN